MSGAASVFGCGGAASTSGGLVIHSAMFDQAVAQLRGLREELRCAGEPPAGMVQAQEVQRWTEQIDTAIADLLEVEWRARYAEALALGAALVDVTVDGPRGGPASRV